jgi:hypothetical protein
MTQIKALTDRLMTLPGDDGWWHVDGLETFVGLADQLIDNGFTPDEAVEFMAAAYGAVANEYGE